MRKGQKMPTELKEKLRKLHKTPRLIQISKNNLSSAINLFGKDNPFYGKKHKPESIEKMKQKTTGKKYSNEINKKKGSIGSKNGNFGKGLKGSLNGMWQGGKCSKNIIIRNSREYKLWRKSVFERDNYKCVWGGKEHGNKLHADHIKPFAYFPELRFAIDNGRTLCVDCHKTTDTYLNNKYKK